MAHLGRFKAGIARSMHMNGIYNSERESGSLLFVNLIVDSLKVDIQTLIWLTDSLP